MRITNMHLKNPHKKRCNSALFKYTVTQYWVEREFKSDDKQMLNAEIRQVSERADKLMDIDLIVCSEGASARVTDDISVEPFKMKVPLGIVELCSDISAPHSPALSPHYLN